jgi:hypothetical protein
MSNKPAVALPSLTSFGFCQIGAATANVVPGTQIRTVSRSGVAKLKKLIQRDGWARHSFLYAVEQKVASLDTLDVIVQKYHETGFVPEGTTICPQGTRGFVVVNEPEEIYTKRRYWTLDGGHRLKARQQLLQDATAKSDKQAMRTHGNIPVIVLSGMTKSQMSCLAAKLNSANAQDYVKTTMLHKYTVLRKQVEFYKTEELARRQVALSEAEEKKNKDEIALAQRELDDFVKHGVVVSKFCAYHNAQLEAFGQSIEDVYSISLKNFSLHVGVAMSLSPELAKRIQTVYDDEVCT